MRLDNFNKNLTTYLRTERNDVYGVAVIVIALKVTHTIPICYSRSFVQRFQAVQLFLPQGIDCRFCCAPGHSPPALYQPIFVVSLT